LAVRLCMLLICLVLAGCSTPAQGDPCEGNEDCGSEGPLFCQHPVGACGETGACQSVDGCEPYACDGWCEVCGCDGVTYNNDCVAQQAGVSIAHFGKCDGESCVQDIECQSDAYPGKDASRYCAQPEGVCRSASSD
jgi:hypothetical protein